MRSKFTGQQDKFETKHRACQASMIITEYLICHGNTGGIILEQPVAFYFLQCSKMIILPAGREGGRFPLSPCKALPLLARTTA